MGLDLRSELRKLFLLRGLPYNLVCNLLCEKLWASTLKTPFVLCYLLLKAGDTMPTMLCALVGGCA